MRYTYRLPLPPSVNHMYVDTSKGKALTKAAIEFRKEVGLILSSRPRFTPRKDRCYSVLAWFTVPPGKHDVDNRLKALLDAIFVETGDERVIAIHARKRKVQAGEEPRCTVRIIELPPTWEES